MRSKIQAIAKRRSPRFSASRHVTPDRPQIRFHLAPQLSSIQLQIPTIRARTVTAEASIHAGDQSYPSHFCLLSCISLAANSARGACQRLPTKLGGVQLGLPMHGPKYLQNECKYKSYDRKVYGRVVFGSWTMKQGSGHGVQSGRKILLVSRPSRRHVSRRTRHGLGSLELCGDISLLTRPALQHACLPVQASAFKIV